LFVLHSSFFRASFLPAPHRARNDSSMCCRRRRSRRGSSRRIRPRRQPLFDGVDRVAQHPRGVLDSGSFPRR
jgi:hypothetical protein